MRKRKQTTAEREERVVSRAVDRVQCDTTRHDRIIAAFEKADAECPADEVTEEVLAAIPSLTEEELMDHLFVHGLLHLHAKQPRY